MTRKLFGLILFSLVINFKWMLDLFEMFNLIILKASRVSIYKPLTFDTAVPFFENILSCRFHLLSRSDPSTSLKGVINYPPPLKGNKNTYINSTLIRTGGGFKATTDAWILISVAFILIG